MRFKKGFCEEDEDGAGALPLGRADETGRARVLDLVRVLDLIGVPVRDVGDSRRVGGGPLETAGGFSESTLTPLCAELVADVDLRWVNTLSRSGDVLCGGVSGRGRENEVEAGIGSSDTSIFCDESGGTVMATNVSTNRAWMTFSRAFCELSGRIVESDTGPAEEGCIITEGAGT